MITYKATGGRVIELFVPFESMGREIKSITISPLKLDHVLRWQKGAWTDSFDMLVEMSKPSGLPREDQTWPEVLRQLRYPDADRVLAIFYDMLPPEIQNNISRGEIPTSATPTFQSQSPQPAGNEDDEGMGLDLSDDSNVRPLTGTDG